MALPPGSAFLLIGSGLGFVVSTWLKTDQKLPEVTPLPTPIIESFLPEVATPSPSLKSRIQEIASPSPLLFPVPEIKFFEIDLHGSIWLCFEDKKEEVNSLVEEYRKASGIDKEIIIKTKISRYCKVK